jgi:hypothetical protein
LWNRKASWTTDCYLYAKGLSPRDVRLPQRGEFVVALGNAARIGIALLAGATFLVFAGCLNAHENEPTFAQFSGPTECAGLSNVRVLFRVVDRLVDWKREARFCIDGHDSPFAWSR